MTGRQQRLTEVFDYVHNNCNIHTKTDFAAKLDYSRPVVSLALNGDTKSLTDKLFKAVCTAWPGTFSLDYLLTGEGELLIPHKPAAPANAAESIIELYATLIKEVEGMRQQLARELSEVHTIRAELRQSIADLQAATLEIQRTRDLLLSTPHNEALPSPTCNKPSGDTHHLSIAAEESETT